MIQVICDEDLVSRLPEKPGPCTEPVQSLDRWCAGLFDFAGETTVLVMCQDNRFGFMLSGMSPEDYAVLPELIASGIRKMFRRYKIREELIGDFLSVPPRLCAGKIQAAKDFEHVKQSLADDDFFFNSSPDHIPLGIANCINQPLHSYHREKPAPLRLLFEGLEARYGQKPVSCRGYEITATLVLESHVARRTLRIPASSTFYKLHRALQTAFYWDDDHPYAFQVGNKVLMSFRYGKPKIGRPVTDADAVTLESLLIRRKKFSYLYDFGDRWEISLRVDSVLHEFDRSYPVCTLREGSSPPEDIGGVPGFAYFLEAVNDPNHEDHETYEDWAEAWMKQPDISKMNHILSFEM